jgi:recA bacterial DNA recombination protein
MGKNWFSKLDEGGSFVDFSKDPFLEGVRSSSPSVNFIFGNTHLLPYGFSMILWGPSKGYKSMLTKDIIGQLHTDDPEALAIVINTELREKVQMNDRVAKEFNIDMKRYRGRDTNKPEEIFDFIENDVAQMCEKGAPVKLLVIDSISDILGRRFLNATTVSTQQMGDHAATVQDGLKRIRAVIRKYNIALILTSHQRDEMDPVEIMRGKKVKMAGANYLKHFAEYFVYTAPNETKDGKTDIFGNKFQLQELSDMNDNPETVSRKVRVMMKGSTVGIAGRTGEFTINLYDGIINTWEELFKLGIARGVLERPTPRSYVLKEYPEAGKEAKWSSFEDAATGVKNNEDVQKEILRRIKLADIDLHQKGALGDVMPNAFEGPVEESEE